MFVKIVEKALNLFITWAQYQALLAYILQAFHYQHVYDFYMVYLHGMFNMVCLTKTLFSSVCDFVSGNSILHYSWIPVDYYNFYFMFYFIINGKSALYGLRILSYNKKVIFMI